MRIDETDPVTFLSYHVREKLSETGHLASVLKLGIVGVSEEQRNEMALRLSTVVRDRFAVPIVDHAEEMTRNLFYGTRYIGTSRKYLDKIIHLWETEYKFSTQNRFRTAWEAYQAIADEIGNGEIIGKHGVKKVILKHIKNKSLGVRNEEA